MSRLALASCLALVLGASSCNRLFYFPSDRLYSVPRAEHRDVLFRTADGVELHAWYFPPRGGAKPRGTFVQFHGNAGNLTSHHRSLVWVTEHDYALFSFDYRGYGRSGGAPTRAGVHLDALAAIDWTLERAPGGGAPRDVVLYGQSLGGAVLLRAFDDVRERARVRAVIIESSFHSYEEVAASVLWRHPLLAPFTGFGFALVSDAYSPAASVARVSPIPLLVLHDVYDPVVPWRFGAAIHGLGRAPKTFWVTHRGGHAQSAEDLDLRRALLAWIEAAPP